MIRKSQTAIFLGVAVALALRAQPPRRRETVGSAPLEPVVNGRELEERVQAMEAAVAEIDGKVQALAAGHEALEGALERAAAGESCVAQALREWLDQRLAGVDRHLAAAEARSAAWEAGLQEHARVMQQLQDRVLRLERWNRELGMRTEPNGATPRLSA